MSQPKTRRNVDTVVIEWYKREPRVSVPVVINLPGVVVCRMVREHRHGKFHSLAGQINDMRCIGEPLGEVTAKDVVARVIVIDSQVCGYANGVV